ncbi:MAG: succinate dehydrogenase [Burkholderiaceae bacterium]|nr:succinate dehydrogenase [Burkholderiaceae bacterium]
MTPAWQARLWLAQRASAMVLAVLLLVHLAGMLWAVRGGLSGAEILERTRGNGWAALLYATLVIASAVHAPIGVARVCEEWFGVRGRALWAAMALLALALMLVGGAAVWGLVR